VPLKKQVEGFLKGMGDAGLNVFKTYKAYKKIEKINFARVIYADNSGIIYGLTENDLIYADVNIEQDVAKVKGMNRLFFIERLYRSMDGTPIIVLSDGNHKAINLRKHRAYYKMHDTQMKNQKPEDYLKVLENSDEKLAMDNLKVDSIDVTLDLNAIDNEMKKDLSVKADRIMSSNMFRLLDDVPNRTIIMMLIIGFLGGSLLTSLFTFFIMIGIEVLKLL